MISLLVGSLGMACEISFLTRRLTVAVGYTPFWVNLMISDGALAEVPESPEGSLCISSFSPFYGLLRTLHRPHFMEMPRSKEDCPGHWSHNRMMMAAAQWASGMWGALGQALSDHSLSFSQLP